MLFSCINHQLIVHLVFLSVCWRGHCLQTLFLNLFGNKLFAINVTNSVNIFSVGIFFFFHLTAVSRLNCTLDFVCQPRQVEELPLEIYAFRIIFSGLQFYFFEISQAQSGRITFIRLLKLNDFIAHSKILLLTIWKNIIIFFAHFSII